MKGSWYYYDGMWERNSKGQGIAKCGGLPSTPVGFCVSHCVYVRGDLLK